jgi:hypothetical protein
MRDLSAEWSRQIHEVLEHDSADLPSQKVRPVNGTLIWMVDEPAASTLSRPAQRP